MKTHLPIKNNNKIEFCCEASNRKDFKRIVRLLQQEYNARIIKKVEGPGAICCQLKIDKSLITVELTDWGIFPLYVTSDKSAEDLMTKIRESIERLPLKEPDLSLLQRLLRLLKELLHID